MSRAQVDECFLYSLRRNSCDNSSSESDSSREQTQVATNFSDANSGNPTEDQRVLVVNLERLRPERYFTNQCFICSLFLLSLCFPSDIQNSSSMGVSHAETQYQSSSTESGTSQGKCV